MSSSQIVGHIFRRLEEGIQVWVNPSWWNLLVVLPWAIGVTLFVHQWKVDREIAAREEIARGVIVTHEPANHNRYGYTFSVKGKTFGGWETPQKREPKIGEVVTVYYDSHAPARNSLTDFADLSSNKLGPVPMLLLGIGAAAWYILSRRLENRRAVPPTVVSS